MAHDSLTVYSSRGLLRSSRVPSGRPFLVLTVVVVVVVPVTTRLQQRFSAGDPGRLAQLGALAQVGSRLVAEEERLDAEDDVDLPETKGSVGCHAKC